MHGIKLGEVWLNLDVLESLKTPLPYFHNFLPPGDAR